jgi:flavin reductase (DIM6/NTAB) family NADH-FMN oxidoreductase RutF
MTMTMLEAGSLPQGAAYKLLIGLVVPRPIAWVTSLAVDGVVNAAPFSAYTFVSTDPPMLGINVGRRAGGLKDTVVNARATGAFVVNVVSCDLGAAMHQSSADYPADVSEPAAIGLELAPSRLVPVPGLAAAPARMECRLTDVIAFGRGPQHLLVGEVVAFHVRADLIDDHKVDPFALDPLGRLGGPRYARLGETLTFTIAPVAAPSEMPA